LVEQAVVDVRRGELVVDPKAKIGHNYTKNIIKI
jgi:hypothetical protein